MKKTIVSAIILALSVAVILLSLKLYYFGKEVVRLQKIEQSRQVNAKILDFTKLFIDKVLASKTEVDFESRLKLENMIREINNAELFDQWNKFTASKEPETAQANVVLLLQMLIDKIQ